MSKAMLFFDPRPQFLTNSLELAAGYHLYFYQPGTSTLKNTYTNVTKSVANPNPIILDSAGRPDNNGTPIDIYLDGTYKVVLKTSADVQIWEVDNVNTLGQQVSTVTKTSDYTIVESDRDKLILVDASAGARVITLLPVATAGDGYNIKVKKIDSSANTVTIQANGAEVIDGVNSYILASQRDYLEAFGNGSYWSIVKGNNQVLRDSNGNPVIVLNATASAVNYFTASNAATGNSPSIVSTGTDTNIDSLIQGKGTGKIRLGQATSLGVQLEGDQPILDSSGNEYLKFTKTASAVNEVTLVNAATGQFPQIAATGGDTDIGLNFQVKGTGAYRCLGTATSSAKVSLFEDTDNGTNSVTFVAPTSIVSDRTYTLPDSNIDRWVVQVVSTITGAWAGGTTTIPFDDTIPQNTEGDQYMSLAITPKNASNVLKIDVVAVYSSSAGTHCITALFQDTTANALAAAIHLHVATEVTTVKFSYVMTAGTTSATTFKVRIGGGGASNINLNGQGGFRLLGGASASSIIITEYSA